MPSLSVVIPVYEEQDSVEELHQGLVRALEPLSLDYEILFVDDGSHDGTFPRLQQIFLADPRVRVIALRRNFGKTAALVAGFSESKGSTVITLDGDLQDDPAEIGRFLQSLDEGNDLTVGWKRRRQDPLTKRLPSKLFNAVLRLLSGLQLHDFNCGFKAYRREVLDDLRLYGDMHRFIPVVAAWKGYRVGEIEVVHHPRRHGRSKFGAGRVVSGLVDFVRVVFLTRYMQQPLRLFGTLGVLLFTLGLIGGIYLAVLKVILGQSIGLVHLPLLLLTVLLLLFGAMMLAIGLIGEMQRHLDYRSSDEYSIRTKLERDA
ncbi:MAG TPA: glycosyltransferase family 2 protein [Chloroflexota bacterium]|nr:glycosyltransferase family 2 protein [Chloroflexota bacterium]